MTDINEIYPFNVMREALHPYSKRESDEYSEDSIRSDSYTPRDLLAMLQTLTPREQRVLELRFRDGLTLKDTGKELNVTQERIRQIEANALRKLCHPSRSKGYASVPYKQYMQEVRAREKAEERLDWILQHGEYKVQMTDDGEIRTHSDAKAGTPPYSLPLDELDFSVRTFNCLARANVTNVAKIVGMTEEELYHIRNLGRKSVEEIVRKIHSLGLKMSWEADE